MEYLRLFVARNAVMIGVLVFTIFFTAVLTTLAKGETRVLPEIHVVDGHAFAWRDNDKAPLKVYDPVAALEGSVRLADCVLYKTIYKGATWCFANKRNLDKFAKHTDAKARNPYVPFLGGRCTLGASWGRLWAPGDPTTARIYTDDRGSKIVVLQSHKKWVPVFNDAGPSEIMRLAEANYTLASTPVRIVPNDKLPAKK